MIEERCMNSTVVALSTPPAKSALAVVRLTGPRAIDIADRVFLPANGCRLSQIAGNTAVYGEFIFEKEAFDDGVALIFKGPKSYTGEDMAELTCHGSMLLAERLITACIAAGAGVAPGGEFTRRAFENGKMDLSAAEAVAELIEADGLAAARAALARRKGLLAQAVDAVYERLVHMSAQLAVWSDFPEEDDAPAVTADGIAAEISLCCEAIDRLQEGHRLGRYLQNGIKIAIVGSPNVGKSTLMNLLAGWDRSIVTKIPGTTRDVVEETIQINGISLKLLDTAGIRETEDEVEKIGIERAKKAMSDADAVIVVVDGSRSQQPQDLALLRAVQTMPHVVALNKTDLPPVVFPQDIGECVEISAVRKEGGEALRHALAQKLSLNEAQSNCLIAGQRQYACLSRAKEALCEALQAVKNGVTLDAVGVLLEDGITPLAELTGKQVREAVLERVFSHFCVGK